NMIQLLGDTFRRHLLRSYADFLRKIHEFVRKLHNPLVESGGEHEILPLVIRGEAAENKAEIGDKAHVEHPVCLVNDQDLNMAERIDLLFEIIYQTARRSDNDVGAFEQGIFLEHVIDAAVDRLDRKAALLAKQLRILVDLDDQFTCRSKDKRPGMTRITSPGLVEQSGEKCYEKGSCFSRTGLSLASHILPFERNREGHFLNRGALGKSGFSYSLAESFRKDEFGKFHIYYTRLIFKELPSVKSRRETVGSTRRSDMRPSG